MTTPSEGYPAFAVNTLVEVVDGKSFVNKIPPTPELQASGWKYQEPPSRAFMNYQFNLIGRWIEELDVRTSEGGTTPIGWIKYSDTQYTSGVPLSVPSGTSIDLPNNGGSVVNASAPSNGDTFYNGAKITANNIGDMYQIGVDLDVSTDTNNSNFVLIIDTGSEVKRIEQRVNTGSVGMFSFSFLVPTDSNFVTNGATIGFSAEGGAMQASNIAYTIHRTFYKDNS